MLISNPAVKEQLKDRIENHYPNPDMNWLRQNAESQFERDYKIATEFSCLVADSNRLTSLRQWRNKWFAHNLNTSFIAPKYGYERKMRKASHRIANALTTVIQQTYFDYDNTVEICRKHADQLWQNIKWNPPELPRG